jgi:hypothetical protein
MDLTTFYATVSGIGFTLLGLWWVVADKHPEWFAEASTRSMAYVVSLHFMIPGSSSLLSLVAPEIKTVWRVVFSLLGASGLVGAALVARQLSRTKVRWSATAMAVALPVYAAVVLVALVPDSADLVDLAPLQVEAILISLVLLLGLHAAWFFNYVAVPPGRAPKAP